MYIFTLPYYVKSINNLLMKKTLFLAAVSVAALFTSCGPKALVPADKGGFETGEYRNVFVEAGYSPKEVDAKLNQVFEEVFFGPDKVYFEVEDSLAYVSDIKNNDVRTEGMSYGMMVAVQISLTSFSAGARNTCSIRMARWKAILPGAARQTEHVMHRARLRTESSIM